MPKDALTVSERYELGAINMEIKKSLEHVPLCYEFALNAGLLMQDKMPRRMNGQKIQNFTEWQNFCDSPAQQPWAPGFRDSFDRGDVLIFVHVGDYAAGKQRHFMISEGGGWFASVNNPVFPGALSEKIDDSLLAFRFDDVPCDENDRRFTGFLRMPAAKISEFLDAMQ